MLLLTCQVPVQGADDDVVVIAHQEVGVRVISHDMARAIFAMRLRTWPDGQAINVFVLPDDDPVHERFAKTLLNVYPHQLRLAWDRVVFSGTGQAPHLVDSEREMLERVASTPGGVGYLERDQLEDSVHVISLAD